MCSVVAPDTDDFRWFGHARRVRRRTADDNCGRLTADDLLRTTYCGRLTADDKSDSETTKPPGAAHGNLRAIVSLAGLNHSFGWYHVRYRIHFPSALTRGLRRTCPGARGTTAEASYLPADLTEPNIRQVAARHPYGTTTADTRETTARLKHQWPRY